MRPCRSATSAITAATAASSVYVEVDAASAWPPASTMSLNRPVCGVEIAVGDDDHGPLAGHGLRSGPSDAGTAACDDRRPLLKYHAVPPLGLVSAAKQVAPFVDRDGLVN